MEMKVLSTMTNTMMGPSIDPEGASPTPLSKKEAKAQASAAKAYAKSQRSWPSRHKFLTGLAALVVAGGIVTALNGRSDTSSTATASSPQVSAQPQAQSSPQASQAPAQPAAPALTAGQENALKAAENYLSFAPFSRKGLIQQLSSTAGDGYSVPDATYAADHVTVNWNEQADKAAKNYLAMTSFSRAGLIEQLSSAAGDGYTVEQATYGVKAAGL